MMASSEIRGPSMQDPATYRITVRGLLDADWSSRLAGMSITHSRRTGGEVATVLVGRLPDQAALAGVLNMLYELHLPMLSAECLDIGP